MWVFYVIALLPLIAGFGVWLLFKSFTWWEWGLATAGGFIVAGIFHLCALAGMTGDQEMRSGRVENVSWHPAWTERYTETRTRTVGSGKHARTETYAVTLEEAHPEHWEALADFGSAHDVYDIDRAFYESLKDRFGGGVDSHGEQAASHGGHSIGGDRRSHITRDKTKYLFPTNKFTRFENRIKAAPTVFSYVTPPPDAPVFEYPKFVNWHETARLVGGAAGRMGRYEWDCMNSRLGPSKRVNVILVGFGSDDRELGRLQEAKYVGGKKNDLVLCYGADASGKVAWSYVFGWTEQEIVKRNLETILIRDPIGNAIIPAIEKEIEANYVIKDWSKFDYIRIEPPAWSYLVLVGVMALVQGAYYAIAFHLGRRDRRRSGAA